MLARYVPVRTLAVYGGTQLRGQIQQIPTTAIVVGTPGRLLDHIGRRTLDPSTIEILVLDEVDRMYDLGFRDDVDRIIECLRQSPADDPGLRHAQRRRRDAHREAHGTSRADRDREPDADRRRGPADVLRRRARPQAGDARALIRDRKPDRTIVFTRTRFTADRVAYALQQEGFDAQEIHSGLPQRRREAILDAFRKGEARSPDRHGRRRSWARHPGRGPRDQLRHPAGRGGLRPPRGPHRAHGARRAGRSPS